MNESGATERANDHPPQEKPRRRIRWYWWLGGFVILLLVGHLIWLATLNKAIESELRAIREAGHPTTASELNEWYDSVPDDQNAALVLRDAFNRLHEPSDEQIKKHLPIMGDAEPPEPTEPLPPAMRSAIEKHLASHEKALKLLHEGAAMERSRYPVDLSRGLDVDLPHLKGLRKGADLLSLMAVHRAEAGDAEKATRSIRGMVGLAESLEREPVLISQFVRIAIHSRAANALERTLNRTALSRASLAELIQALDDTKEPSAMVRGLIGERAMFSAAFTPSSAGSSRPGYPDGAFTLLRALGIAQLDRVTYLGLLSDGVEAAKLPPHEQFAAYERLERNSSDLPLTAVMTKILLPSISRAGEINLRSLATLRTARAGLAVERYRAANGSLPESLIALTPEFIDTIPLDPFTGDPLKYKQLKTGYTVYSVGEDKKDHGGALTNSAGDEYEPGADIPFTVKRDAE